MKGNPTIEQATTLARWLLINWEDRDADVPDGLDVIHDLMRQPDDGEEWTAINALAEAWLAWAPVVLAAREQARVKDNCEADAIYAMHGAPHTDLHIRAQQYWGATGATEAAVRAALEATHGPRR